MEVCSLCGMAILKTPHVTCARCEKTACDLCYQNHKAACPSCEYEG